MLSTINEQWNFITIPKQKTQEGGSQSAAGTQAQGSPVWVWKILLKPGNLLLCPMDLHSLYDRQDLFS
jgi:hypothetical protein